jgi:hypothetical protein
MRPEDTRAERLRLGVANKLRELARAARASSLVLGMSSVAARARPIMESRRSRACRVVRAGALLRQPGLGQVRFDACTK